MINKEMTTIRQYVFAASYCISRFEYLLKNAMNIQTISDCFSNHRQELEGLCEKITVSSELQATDGYFEFMCGIDRDARYEKNPLEFYDDAIKHFSCDTLKSELTNEELSDKIYDIYKNIEDVTFALNDLGLSINTDSLLHKGKTLLQMAFFISIGGVLEYLEPGAISCINVLEPVYVISGEAKEQFVKGLQSFTEVIILEQNNELIRIQCPKIILSVAGKNDTSDMIMKLYNELTGSIQITKV